MVERIKSCWMKMRRRRQSCTLIGWQYVPKAYWQFSWLSISLWSEVVIGRCISDLCRLQIVRGVYILRVGLLPQAQIPGLGEESVVLAELSGTVSSRSLCREVEGRLRILILPHSLSLLARALKCRCTEALAKVGAATTFMSAVRWLWAEPAEPEWYYLRWGLPRTTEPVKVKKG